MKKEYGKFSLTRVKELMVQEEKIAAKRKKRFVVWVGFLSSEEKKLVNFLQEVIRLRDERKDHISKCLVVVFRLAQQVFKQAGVSARLIYYTAFDEFKRGPDYVRSIQDKIEKRPDGYSVLITYSGDLLIEYGKFEENQKILAKFYTKDHRVSSKILEGQSGSEGIGVGRVRIVRSTGTEAKFFKKGEVLVTGMTRPEYIQLMKKASAIVTDEGGITCHAAIVSRELKKPCVIGTKVATLVLKDGDLVEVDANKGMVRKIK